MSLIRAFSVVCGLLYGAVNVVWLASDLRLAIERPDRPSFRIADTDTEKKRFTYPAFVLATDRELVDYDLIQMQSAFLG